MFQSGLPTTAPGALKKREDMSLLGTPKEKTLFVAQGDYYTKFAKACTEVLHALFAHSSGNVISKQNGVVVDLFVFPSGFMDLATIGAIASTTGGAIYRYSHFKTGSDTSRVRCHNRIVYT